MYGYDEPRGGYYVDAVPQHEEDTDDEPCWVPPIPMCRICEMWDMSVYADYFSETSTGDSIVLCKICAAHWDRPVTHF